MLTQYLQKLGLREKLFIIHLMIVGFALSLVFVIVMIYQYSSYKNELTTEIESQLEVIQKEVINAIVHQDSRAAEQSLRVLNMNKNIEQAYVELDKYEIFAEYHADSTVAGHHPKVALFAMLAGELELNQDIFANKQRIATIHVDATLSAFNERIKFFGFTLMLAAIVAMLTVKVISRRLNKYITEPISYLETMVSNMTKNHNYTDRSKIVSLDEIGALSTGINNMLDNIKLRDDRLIEELQQRIAIEQKLDNLAYYDGQTKLPNRHAFTEKLNQLMGMHATSAGHFYLLMLDLDNFKVVNDTYGHEYGDQLLFQCGQRLRWILHEEDIVFRLGGDEFAIILRAVKTVQDVEKICGRITHALAQQFMIDSQEIFVGVSIGVVQYQDNNYSESNLVKNADVAMYWAKAAGKNTYKFYTAEIEDANYHQQKLIADLQIALKNNEFELYYQPIIDAESARIVGFEALLRWYHPEEGIISPAVFIPLAENNGLITPIGEWVIKKALAQLSVWQTQFDENLFVNINLSARQFFDRRIVSVIGTALKDTGVTPQSINFELTESLLMEDVDRAVGILSALKEMGAGISVDDFGTGHSSMSYLKQFPVDTIKIDKSFVRGLPRDGVDTAIIEAIFALAKSLQLEVVAEGVETEEQFDFLRAKHCKKVQGYLFSPPVAVNKIEALLYQSNMLAERFQVATGARY